MDIAVDSVKRDAGKPSGDPKTPVAGPGVVTLVATLMISHGESFGSKAVGVTWTPLRIISGGLGGGVKHWIQYEMHR